MVVPVHNHTEYSALDGLARIEEVASRCVELGCPCCGITDHHTVAGHLEFAKVMDKHGIKPIFGCELYHGVKTEFGKNERDASHLIVGALTDKGLRNLWSLMDAAAPNFRFVSRVNWDLLRKYREGLFATSACALGLVSKGIVNDDYDALNQYLDIFGDDFYIELHTYPGDKAFKDVGQDGEPINQRILNLALTQVAEERGIPVIYADDAHRARKEDYDLFDMYIASKTGQTIYTPVEDRKMWHPEEAMYIKSEDEIRASLDYLPDSVVDEAIANSVALGERVNASLPEVKRHLPVFFPHESPWLGPTLNEEEPADVLTALVYEGVEERYGDDAPQHVWDRVNRELEVFIEAGLEHYFLLAWDLVQYCRANDIEIGPGRGSAAGCVVAYCLRITDIDPFPYELIFERFWNPGRAKGFPDIDMDFPRARRRDILHYLEERWGKDRVRPIGNVGRMKPKSVVDKTFKALAVTEEEAKELKRILDNVPDLEIHDSNVIGWAEETEPGKRIYVMDHVGEEIVEWLKEKPASRREVLANWLWYCQHLCSRVAGYGMHASGIVVSDVDLPDELPSRWHNDEKLRITMFDMEDVDKRMFIKMDVLGLRTLDTLTEWKRLLKEQGVDFEWSGMERLPVDESMWELFDKGLTVGLFQVEDKPAVRKLVMNFKPRSVEDLSIIVALNRPGPLRAAAGEEESTAERFVKRKTGQQDVVYPHPFLEEILKPTYGLFLYQEQVIQFFRDMGYDLGDADAIRKIMGKKKPEEMIKVKTGEDEWEGKGFLTIAPEYVDGAAEKIWDALEGFASYSFNKSHSAAYGTITWRTAFAKRFGTPEWFIAAIRTDEKRVGKHVAEARRMGLDVLPPDILISGAKAVYDEEGQTIRYGFGDIKGIGWESAEYVVELRNMYGESVRTRAGLEAAVEAEKVKWQERQKAAKKALQPFDEKSPKMKLQSNKIDALQLAGAFDNYEDRMVTLQGKQELEKELLGLILTDDSKEAFANNHEVIMECDTIEEVNESWDGEDVRYTVPGVVTFIKETKTKKDGKKMAIVTIEYAGEEAQFAVFPKQWRTHKFLWKERVPGLFNLRRTARGLNFEEGIKLNP